MTVTFTLTGGSASTDAGPFNISGTTSGGALNGVSIATGITKQQLLTGHTVTNINDTITGGTIASTGTCTTTDTWSVTPSPTPTSTPITPTPTAVPFYTYYVGASNLNRVDACSNFDMEPQTEVYADTNSPSLVSRFFTDTSLITPFSGSGNFYAWRLGFSDPASHGGQVSSSGFVTNVASC